MIYVLKEYATIVCLAWRPVKPGAGFA